MYARSSSPYNLVPSQNLFYQGLTGILCDISPITDPRAQQNGIGYVPAITACRFLPLAAVLDV